MKESSHDEKISEGRRRFWRNLMGQVSLCDCHSLVAGREGNLRHADYVRLLLRDLDAFRNLGDMADRPVTTVHLGGGTPDSVGHDLLALGFRRLHVGVQCLDEMLRTYS